MRFRTTYASVLLAAFALGLLCLPVPALAQEMPDFPQHIEFEEAGAAATGMGCACIIAMLVCSLVGLAIQIAICVYVYRDATARGMDNAVLWLILAIFFPLIGPIIYLIVRPKPGA